MADLDTTKPEGEPPPAPGHAPEGAKDRMSAERWAAMGLARLSLSLAALAAQVERGESGAAGLRLGERLMSRMPGEGPWRFRDLMMELAHSEELMMAEKDGLSIHIDIAGPTEDYLSELSKQLSSLEVAWRRAGSNPLVHEELERLRIHSERVTQERLAHEIAERVQQLRGEIRASMHEELADGFRELKRGREALELAQRQQAEALANERSEVDSLRGQVYCERAELNEVRNDLRRAAGDVAALTSLVDPHHDDLPNVSNSLSQKIRERSRGGIDPHAGDAVVSERVYSVLTSLSLDWGVHNPMSLVCIAQEGRFLPRVHQELRLAMGLTAEAAQYCLTDLAQEFMAWAGSNSDRPSRLIVRIGETLFLRAMKHEDPGLEPLEPLEHVR